MKILVTGAAGFIGFHISLNLLKQGHKVYSIDSLDKYYDLNLKNDRIKILKKFKYFKFSKFNLSNKILLDKILKKNKIKYVVHLAAQAGVRYSIENSNKYFKSNLEGFFNILELCKNNKIKHLLFASSSSVYGDTDIFPSKENQITNMPVSFYAATKMSNELMAYSYSNIHKLPSTAMRFFTAYGSYGRPDMAIHKFTKSIKNSKEISLYEYGKNLRDFTHIDDISEMILRLLKKPSLKKIPYNCFNLGNGRPITSKKLLNIIEKKLNKRIKTHLLPKQDGEVTKTHANINALHKYINYKPKKIIENGIDDFLNWYNNYY